MPHTAQPTNKARSEELAQYAVERATTTAEEDAVIAHALRILAGRMQVTGVAFGSPSSVSQYCQLRIGGLPHEVFGVLFLDAQNRLIEYREMFRGTLTQTSVYPREVVKEALALNAAAVILTHNHPSGTLQPSRADEALTKTMKSALDLVDVRVLDHIIATAEGSLSFAARGLL